MKDLTLPTPAIKPCPFCGGEASARPRTCNRNTPYNPADRAFPIVRCGKCGAEAIGDDWKSEATAIEKWNRRAALSSNQAATDKESLTAAPVALGGEKGEAVAHGSGSPLDGLTDKYGTRWGAPDEMGWSFEQHAFQDFCAEFSAAVRASVADAARGYMAAVDAFDHACHVDGDTPGGAPEQYDAAEDQLKAARKMLEAVAA